MIPMTAEAARQCQFLVYFGAPMGVGGMIRVMIWKMRNVFMNSITCKMINFIIRFEKSTAVYMKSLDFLVTDT